ncbi:MAG: alkaline phosphatase family protein [Deltaproteobacteria bacterium]|nr:alkaline phosphatase family protein [Deltaproteobacteria bacterium]MBW2387800.1 alkaline phosphatase family protein [Deltaproteobacteria bacterium]
MVIWLSLDGVRYDYPDRGPMPGFERLAREGAHAERLIPIFPSSTFPNHVAMATCARADRHGIVGNHFYDPVRGEFDYANDGEWLEAEPIWASAERQGVRSAVFFWVGSETAWRGHAASYRMRPFDDGLPDSLKVDQILDWVDLGVAERPGLILSWWHGADRVGHARGPDDPGIRLQLAKQDEQLLRLLAGLDERNAWGYTTLFVTSDHGMTSVRHEIDVVATLARAEVKARVHSGSAVALVYLADVRDLQRAEAALREVPGHGVHRAAAVPEALRFRHPRRTGDLVLIAEPPHFYKRGGRMAAIIEWLTSWSREGRGAHGYPPALPDMSGIFYAMGRGIASGLELGPVSNLDIAPTVSELLAINAPKDCEGTALRELGEAFDEAR